MISDYQLAQRFVESSGMRWCDAVRLVLDLYDHVPENMRRSADACFLRMKEMVELGAEAHRVRHATRSLSEVMELSISARLHRRFATRSDLRYFARRILRSVPEAAGRPLRAMSTRECRGILTRAFHTPAQYRKGRAFLSSVFAYGVRQEWCEENPVLRIEVPVVREGEIRPLSMAEIRRLLDVAGRAEFREIAPALGLMLWAGIRPNEVRRLQAEDVDLRRGFVYVKPRHSKTGGGRQVPIRPALQRWLQKHGMPCAWSLSGWSRRWRSLRAAAGFEQWQQDVLRHTFASYHVLCFADLPMLQLEMGHRSVELLRTRYVNVLRLRREECRRFFECM